MGANYLVMQHHIPEDWNKSLVLPWRQRKQVNSMLIGHQITSHPRHINVLSVVGIMMRYKLDGPGVEPWWRQEIFCSPCLSRLALGSTQPPLQWAPWLFKAARAW
jgi:hypothetical protein